MSALHRSWQARNSAGRGHIANHVLRNSKGLCQILADTLKFAVLFQGTSGLRADVQSQPAEISAGQAHSGLVLDLRV